MRDRGAEQWTDMCDRLLGELHDQGLGGKKAIAGAMAAIPLPAQVSSIWRRIVAQPGGVVHILSDSNTVYIEQVLHAYCLSNLVSSVTTNPAHYDDKERLHVQRFTPACKPHGCDRCPVNLCKGRVVDAMPRSEGVRRVYVGDGGNDYCPATRMLADDVVFAREGYSLAKKIRKQPITAAVRYWETYQQLLDAMVVEGVIPAEDTPASGK